jgi:uncharacterized protein YccT (UPF0319 family)
MIGCILATDMAKHSSDLSSLKTLVELNDIHDGVNAENIINRSDDASLFKSQQLILECCLHTCDVS